MSKSYDNPRHIVMVRKKPCEGDKGDKDIPSVFEYGVVQWDDRKVEPG